MKGDALMRLVNRRLAYKVLLEERIRQLETALETVPDSVIAGKVEELWQRARRNWKHVTCLLAKALGDIPPPIQSDDSTDAPLRQQPRGGGKSRHSAIEANGQKWMMRH